jgi:phosphatidylglycerol---prolipoprotein diacylglyceryl transferase
VILWVLPRLADDQGLPIRGYGVMVLLAVMSGLGLLVWRARRAGADSEMLLSLSFWMIVPGIIGARLFYVLEYWHDNFEPALEHGWPALVGAVVNVTQGGLIVYGAFFGGVVGFVAFYCKYRIKILPTFDLLAPSLMLGLAIGRIGCLMHGCCFGGPSNVLWALEFPKDSPPYESQARRGELYGFTLSGNANAPAVLLAVRPGSEADAAGLKAGDRLEMVNGYATASAGDAYWAMKGALEHEKSLVITLEGGRLVTLPALVPPPEHSLAIQPTQIYASINALLLCLVLLVYDHFSRRDG